MFIARTICLGALAVFSTTPLVRAAETTEATRQKRQWVQAKFQGIVPSRQPTGYLRESLKSGVLLKNMATTKVYHKEIGALPLKIVDKTFQRGIFCPSTGSVTVHLPSPAKRLTAVFGVDSNRVGSFYSNAGRGRVVGGVEVAGTALFRSPVMREGLQGVPVAVELKGARQFTLSMKDAGGGIVQRVDFNQTVWADARVELQNGKSVWLGDLPTAPLRQTPTTDLPFSFRYGGISSRQLLSRWKRNYGSRALPRNRTEHQLTFNDPQSGLRLRCVAIEYHDFPVVEWKLFFKNAGKQPTPIIQDIQPLHTAITRDNEGEFVLHHSNGSPHSLIKMSDRTDYAPRTTRLAPQSQKQLGSKIGLPASNDLPFFNIEANGEGLIAAIGWPGQWTANLVRDKTRALRLTAGQELTHFRLLPGEEVRSPLIALMFWKGKDWIDGQNLWRRWMIKHNLPRTADGKLPPQHHAASSSAFYMEASQATEKNQIEFIDRYVKERLKPDYWWIDAGWHEFHDYWLNVGTWRPNQRRFPRGLKPISDHLHRHNMKLILWFTPELVTRGSQIDKAHPEWLLKGAAEWWMGHALIQGEYPAHVNDSGLTLLEDVAAFGTGNPDRTVTGKTRLADGKWHLVTATRRVDRGAHRSDLRLYVDGKLDAQGYSPNIAPLTANDSWGVGRQYQTRGIIGSIDDVRVYDSALSSSDVLALFQGKSTKAPAQRYPFDGSLSDVAGKRDGQKIGSGDLKFVSGGALPGKGRFLSFDNSNGVKIPNQTPDSFTLSCWVRMSAPQPPPWGRGDFRLLDFSNPAVVEWMTNHVDLQIKQQGVDLFRHDGIPPLKYWRANDAIDRQGITEIRHIEGLLKFWDELRRRHPMLRIDICSGGGSRNELEALRRAVPLWRSDYAYETTGMQALTYGMAHWIPYFGAGINASDAYTFRSQLAPANVTSWDMRRRDIDFDDMRRMLSERRRVAQYYYGDFFPLTTYRTADDVWMAWQFHTPASDSGVVQVFRRPKSAVTAMQFKLRGITPGALYKVQNVDSRETRTLLGKELAGVGLSISLSRPRSAALLFYQRVK